MEGGASEGEAERGIDPGKSPDPMNAPSCGPCSPCSPCPPPSAAAAAALARATANVEYEGEDGDANDGEGHGLNFRDTVETLKEARRKPWPLTVLPLARDVPNVSLLPPNRLFCVEGSVRRDIWFGGVILRLAPWRPV